jgi:CRP/FNR family transcriptional regulator, cyclic AMP receptor protein
VDGASRHLAYILRWTFVRTLSERPREGNGKIKALFVSSRF